MTSPTINNNDENNKLFFAKYEQLHNATLNFSKTCFELKKLCVTIIMGIITISISLNEDIPELVLMCIIATITILFYILDVFTYYYQDSLRSKMFFLEKTFKDTNNLPQEAGNNKHEKRRKLRSLFNWSMLIYLLIIAFDVIAYFIINNC